MVVVVIKHASHTPSYMLARGPPDEDEPPDSISLVHLADELVDVGLPVTEVTALDEVLELPCPPAASGVRELEWPEEVGSLLEVWASGDDLVNEILNTEDIVLSKSVLNYCVGSKGDTLLVDLSVTTLVDELTNRLKVGFTRNNSIKLV